MLNQIRIPVFATLTLSLMVPLPTLSVAQTGAPGVVYTVVLPAGKFGSQNFTTLLVNGLASAHKFCGKLDSAYQVDCLSERIDAMAKQIPEGSDYVEVQDALEKASDQINSLARANRDRALPRGSASAAGETTTTRPLTPVAADAQAQVNQQALAILQDTQTLLLRSAEASESKLVHYQRIADAIGSNKVLLRSA